MNWISVHENMPDLLRSVIVWGKLIGDSEPYAHEAFRCTANEWASVRSSCVFEYVLWWQPMPDGPESKP